MKRRASRRWGEKNPQSTRALGAHKTQYGIKMNFINFIFRQSFFVAGGRRANEQSGAHFAGFFAVIRPSSLAGLFVWRRMESDS